MHSIQTVLTRLKAAQHTGTMHFALLISTTLKSSPPYFYWLRFTVSPDTRLAPKPTEAVFCTGNTPSPSLPTWDQRGGRAPGSGCTPPSGGHISQELHLKKIQTQCANNTRERQPPRYRNPSFTRIPHFSDSATPSPPLRSVVSGYPGLRRRLLSCRWEVLAPEPSFQCGPEEWGRSSDRRRDPPPRSETEREPRGTTRPQTLRGSREPAVQLRGDGPQVGLRGSGRGVQGAWRRRRKRRRGISGP